MRKVVTTIAISIIVFVGCKNDREVEVYISKSHYSIGKLTFDIATSAVDEVVRLDASVVKMHACLSTPAERILQFQKELVARSQATVSFHISEWDARHSRRAPHQDVASFYIGKEK